MINLDESLQETERVAEYMVLQINLHITQHYRAGTAHIHTILYNNLLYSVSL